MMSHHKIFDYINNVVSLADSPEDYKTFNFAILCDKYPIQISKNNFLAKVMYISIQTPKSTWRLYPDKITEYDIEHVIITSNARRRLNSKMNEFFINGNNEEHEYKDNKFYNYSIENTSKSTKEMILKLREKYNLTTPTIFQGEHQELVLE